MVNGTLVKRIDEKGFEIEISMYCGELKKIIVQNHLNTLYNLYLISNLKHMPIQK